MLPFSVYGDTFKIPLQKIWEESSLSHNLLVQKCLKAEVSKACAILSSTSL